MDVSNSASKIEKINKAIFESAPIGIAVISDKGIFESVNQEFLKIHGYQAPDEFVGRSALEFIFYQESGLDNFIRQVLAGQKFDTQIVFTPLAGAKESFRRYKGTPIFGQDEKTIEGMVLIVQDLTNERRLESDVQDYIAKLKQEQSRFLASINSLSLGFMIIDIRTNLLIKNKAADAILELPHEGEIFFKGDIIETEENLKKYFDLKANYEKCIAEGKVIDAKEIVFEEKFLHIYIAPIVMMQDSQSIIGAVILIEDITEAKVIERSKDEFFSIASHELRTPLTAIRGNASMIKDYYAEAITDPELKAMIEDIHASSLRLIDIVNDFLNMSRLELKKIEFKKEKFDVAALIEEAIKELKATAEAKKLFIKPEAPAQKLFDVLADKDRTKEVLINLIGNSLKYTETGGVTIIPVQVGSMIKISVADTGRGIPLANQNLLFHKFQQAGENLFTRDTTKGTGLGLYISKLMVEGMGGTIGLEKSEPGKGSVFFFTLPIA